MIFFRIYLRALLIVKSQKFIQIILSIGFDIFVKLLITKISMKAMRNIQNSELKY